MKSFGHSEYTPSRMKSEEYFGHSTIWWRYNRVNIDSDFGHSEYNRFCSFRVQKVENLVIQSTIGRIFWSFRVQ